MSSTCRGHYLCFLLLILIPCISLENGLGAQEKPPAPSSKPGIGPERLPEILAEGSVKLRENIATLQQREESGAQALETIQKEREELQARIAALTASMAVNELSLAGAREAVDSLGKEREKLSAKLKEVSEEQGALWKKIQERASGLRAVEDQMAELANAKHPLLQSAELQKAYRDYGELGRQYDAAAKTCQDILGKMVESLQNSVNLVTEAKTRLEKDYLERALKQELLKRQSTTHRLQEVGQILVTLATLPGKAYSWLGDAIQSGAFFAFIARNWSNLTGLLLFLVMLGLGTIGAGKLVLQRLIVWQEQVEEVGLKVFLTAVRVLATQLFPLGSVAWLYVAFWSLGIISNKVAWLVWSLLASLAVLRFALHFLHRCLAGDEAGGVIPIPRGLATFYRRNLSFIAICFCLVRLFVIPNAENLGLTPEDAGTLKTFFQVAVLGWVVWLTRKHRLDPVLEVLPAPTFLRNKGFLRFLRISIALVFAFIVVSGLLGLKFLFEYAARGACFTLVVLIFTWVLGEAAHTLLRLTVDPEMGAIARRFPGRERLLGKFHRSITRAVKVVLAGVAIWLTMRVWGVPANQLARVFAWLNWGPTLGPLRLTPLNIGLTVLVITLGFWVSRALRTLAEHRLYRAREWDPGIQYTVSMSIHYVVLVFTALIALNTIGLSLSNLALVAGGLGVGIGFGLQNIVSNFLSGLILLFERPIKVGDMLIIDGQWGMVKEIRVRSTIFQTFDRYFLIIPNSDLVSGKILNWTYRGWGVNRLTLKVGVSYGSDPLQVTRIIEDVCRANQRVVADPPPQIFFEAYGDSSLNFNIWVFLASPNDRIPATHELNSAIFEAFQAHGIEIPFPQTDLHVRSWSTEARPPVPVQAER